MELRSTQISRRKLLATLASAAAVGCSREKGAQFDGFAFVANEEGKSIAAVDLGTFSVAKHIGLGDAPSRVIAHSSKPLLYALTPRSGTIYEIDANSLTIKRKVQPARSLVSMRPALDGDALWALAREDGKLIRISLESLKVERQIQFAPGADGFDIEKWHDRGVVTHRAEGTIAFLDLKAGKAHKPIKLAPQLGAVQYLSDGQSLIAANVAENVLTAVEAENGRVITHLPLSLRPDNLCFNRDGGQLFISGAGQDAIVIVYPYFVPQIAETVLAGSSPGAMAATGRFLFIANPLSGHVSILNIARRKVVAVAAVGSDPGHIAITPNEQYALVLNRGSGDMAVIRTAAILPDRRKTAALFTMIPVGSKPVSAAILSFA